MQILFFKKALWTAIRWAIRIMKTSSVTKMPLFPLLWTSPHNQSSMNPERASPQAWKRGFRCLYLIASLSPGLCSGQRVFFRQSRVIANELPRRKQRDLWDRRHAWQEAQTRFRYRQGRAIELVAHLERRLPAAA